MKNKEEENILFNLIKNKISIEDFFNSISVKTFFENQLYFLMFSLMLLITLIIISISINDYTLLMISLPLFFIVEAIIIYYEMKEKSSYYKLFGKKQIKEIKNKEFENKEELFIYLLDELSDKEFNDNIEDILYYIIKNIGKEVYSCIDGSRIDFDNENVIKCSFIITLIKIKAGSNKTVIEFFLENEEKFNKYLNEITFKKLKYGLISKNLEAYISSNPENYFEDVINYVDEVNLNNENVYLLKEKFKIKNRKIPTNILNELNTEMVCRF